MDQILNFPLIHWNYADIQEFLDGMVSLICWQTLCHQIGSGLREESRNDSENFLRIFWKVSRIHEAWASKQKP